MYVFFFQAEDGIRDDLVTGVQTCALPISLKEPKAKSATGWSSAGAWMRSISLTSRWWGVLLLIQLLSESFCPRCPSIAQAREFFIPIPNGPTRAWKAATRVIASTTARISGNWEATLC